MRAFISTLLASSLVFASICPAPARAEPDRDYFVDSRGERVLFRPVYEGWFGANRYPHRWGRMLGENAAAMGFELFIYWNDPNGNSVDWQYPDLITKLSQQSVARFDDNLERTNWLLHPAAGALHYGLTRVNGFGVLPSFATAAIASGLYESVFEWREIISINDLVVTPFGGMAVGEFFFQLGNYLNSEQARPRRLDEVTGPDEFGRRVSAITLGLARHANNALDAPPPPPLVPDDSLGLSSAYTHRFEFFMGEDFARNDAGDSAALTALGLSAEIVAMPGFLRPGSIHTSFSGGNFTRFSLRTAFDASLRELDISADAHLFGGFSQELRAVPGGRTGYANEIAGHTMLHYVDRWLEDRRDQYALLHLLGAVDNLWLPLGHTTLRLGADVSPDFAAPYSLAYERFRLAYGPGGAKSSLEGHGYYFALGASAGVQATLAVDAFSLGVEGRYGRYESIDGAERMQEQVTRDPHLHDEILELAARTAFEPPDIPLALHLDAAHVGRRSHMAPFTARRSDERVGVAVGLRF